MILEFWQQIFENTQISDFPKIHPMGAELFHADRRTNRHDNANFFFYWRYNPFWFVFLQPSSGAIASSRTRFLDHTQRRATVGRTPLDE